jgi:hypothetical protein
VEYIEEERAVTFLVIRDCSWTFVLSCRTKLECSLAAIPTNERGIRAMVFCESRLVKLFGIVLVQVSVVGVKKRSYSCERMAVPAGCNRYADAIRSPLRFSLLEICSITNLQRKP